MRRKCNGAKFTTESVDSVTHLCEPLADKRGCRRVKLDGRGLTRMKKFICVDLRINLRESA